LDKNNEYKSILYTQGDELVKVVFEIIEQMFGCDLSNFEEICRIALEAGVQKIIPHVYTSIVDPQTGKTKVEDIQALLEIIEKL